MHTYINHDVDIWTVGFVCSLDNLWPSGCCDNSLPITKRFDCLNCFPTGCCSVYEMCVSCCLDPDKVRTLHSAAYTVTVSLTLYSNRYMGEHNRTILCTNCFFH